LCLLKTADNRIPHPSPVPFSDNNIRYHHQFQYYLKLERERPVICLWMQGSHFNSICIARNMPYVATFSGLSCFYCPLRCSLTFIYTTHLRVVVLNATFNNSSAISLRYYTFNIIFKCAIQCLYLQMAEEYHHSSFLRTLQPHISFTTPRSWHVCSAYFQKL
jgi:hypothetical protein